jgi:glycosyltransferase involved in cell wall biosynthesis
MKLKGNLVSVIIPAYNVSKYIYQAIQSILDQTYSNLEILVADDGSTDSTRKIIDSFADKRIRRFHNAKNIGKVKTCDKLFSKVKGEFITFQDADDFSHPDRINELIIHFKNDRNVKMAGSNVAYCKSNGNLIRYSEFPESYNEIENGLPNKFYFTGATVMITKEILNKYGGYNDYLKFGGEDPYWIGCIALENKFINVKKALYYYRLTPNSLSRKVINYKQIISLDIVSELLKQRIETGTDILEMKNTNELEKLEQQLIEKYKFNKNWVIEKSIHRDIGNEFLFRAYRKSLIHYLYTPLSLSSFKTFLTFQLTIFKKIIKIKKNISE